MDDSTRLVAELLGKLADLDYKVNEYRQEMAHEFQRYSHQLLQHVPLHVRAQVEKIMASKMQNYPALNLDHFPALDSLSTDLDHNALPDHQALGCGKVTPPPLTLPGASIELPSDGTRSPHEREREFVGLFTPSYLPLLDAVQRPNPPPTATPATPTSPPQSPQSPRSPRTKEPNGSRGIASPSNPPGNLALPRPDPVRRSTGDTVSSSTSDDSALRAQRRSALRRSSSSSTKTQSPRRVRFEVEGQEVLTTMSPPISPRISDLPSYPQSSPTRMLDDSYGEAVLDDKTGLLGSSPPRPKKLTSTDRLKAMARNLNEDTSKWTVVDNSQGLSDDDDDELVMASSNGHSQAANSSSNAKGGAVHHINDKRFPAQSSPSLEVVHEITDDQFASDDDDDMDDTLEMPLLSSFKGKKRFSPPQDTEVRTEHQTAKTQGRKDAHSPATNSHGSDLPQTIDEDIFLFDDNPDGTSNSDDRAKATSKYIEDEEEEEEEGEITPIPGDQRESSAAALYSRSPGVPIAKPPPPPPASALSKQIAASAGSYKGRPFSIGIVRDPELHKRAAEMGDLYSFVGSVDGRSGVDESSSYRPELASFNGTPRSLSERLLMEELEAARREASADKRD
ncbi:hypothetical protein F4809DRAFT_521465 [Biscogniauxia mediterranea]|nr:hypothetical protein F4809DRAFT_521465 [Biscogniauxia mediterranea]